MSTTLSPTESLEQVNGLVTEFFEILRYPKVEAGEFSKSDVDRAQEITEQVESLRIVLESTFTEEELAGFERKQLQRIAKEQGIKATQSSDVLRNALVGVNKSIRPRRQLREMFSRLKLARDKIGYYHPRQNIEG